MREWEIGQGTHVRANLNASIGVHHQRQGGMTQKKEQDLVVQVKGKFKGGNVDGASINQINGFSHEEEEWKKETQRISPKHALVGKGEDLEGRH